MSLWRRICEWGTTRDEIAADWPCDRRARPGEVSYFRGVDVDAEPARVFRWLCQLKAAPYSYDWLDNGGRQSPRRLTPGLERLATGQRVMAIFELVDFVRDRSMTLVSGDSAWLGRVVVTYQALPRAGGGTRLLARLRITYRNHPIGWLARLGLPFGDWIMMRKQLLTLKELAEATADGAQAEGSGP
jgi:hypothetical protein